MLIEFDSGFRSTIQVFVPLGQRDRLVLYATHRAVAVPRHSTNPCDAPPRGLYIRGGDINLLNPWVHRINLVKLEWRTRAAPSLVDTGLTRGSSSALSFTGLPDDEKVMRIRQTLTVSRAAIS